ncbi:MAG: hypothetical protein K9L89_06155 [Kiritimatiellales bacterium]|nr:hypothetical protein [Kiritimatiellales bacterium]
MNYLNLYVPILRSPEFCASSDKARSTWLSLMAFCVEQENGGCIKGAAVWNNRQWLQHCGVSKKVTQSAEHLIHFNAQDVWVHFYPLEMEAKAKGLRNQAIKAANHRWSNVPNTTPSRDAGSIAPGNAERKKKERKGKEGNTYNPDFNFPSLPTDLSALRADPCFVALATAEGSAIEELTRSALAQVVQALKEIREVCPNLSPDEIRLRVGNYRSNMPGMRITSNALMRHWAACATAKPNPKTLNHEKSEYRNAF